MDDYGGYLVASGDEDLNTRLAELLIMNEYQSGIVYSSHDQNKCESMYEFCKGFTKEVDDLKITEIKLISELDTDDWDKYKILIGTQDLLSKGRPKDFLKYKYNEYNKCLDYITRSVLPRPLDGLLPRKTVIIDGLPKDDLIYYYISAIFTRVIILTDDHKVTRKSKKSIIDEYKRSHPDKVVRIEGLKIDYPPKLIYSDGRKINIKSKLFGTGLGSRVSRLKARSVQEKLMDLLVRINYFGVRIIPETLIPRKHSYYLVDYYLPDNRLIIELDSAYHDPEKDSIRDQYLKELGLDVVRFDDFTASQKELDNIRKVINSTKSRGELNLDFFWDEDIKFDETCYYNLPDTTLRGLIPSLSEMSFMENLQGIDDTVIVKVSDPQYVWDRDYMIELFSRYE